MPMQSTRNTSTILVAEDEPEVRGYFEMALSLHGLFRRTGPGRRRGIVLLTFWGI